MPRYIGYKPTGTANSSVTFTSTVYGDPFLLKNHEDLVFLIDVADSNSYSGSGSTLVNLCTSPADGSAASAYNFTLGAGFTFTGVAGDLKRTTYLTHAGAASSASIINVATNTTFIESLHKDNANWTAIVIWLKGSGGKANYGQLMSTGSYSPSSGMGWYSLNGANSRFGLNVVKSVSGQVALNVVGNEYIEYNSYNFMAVSINEASASGGFFYRNGKYDQTASSLTFNPTYSSPSTSAAQYTLRLWNGGGSGGVTYPMNSTDRFIAAMMFNRALSKAELDDIYKALSARVMTNNACSLADTTITIPHVRPAKPLQGYPGGTTSPDNTGQGGGGGAGAAGAANSPGTGTGGAGGAGKTSPLDSTARAGGGGGGGGAGVAGPGGSGGSGGGGAGATGPVSTTASPGSTNTGGGGGGGALNTGISGSGGPGIVMFTTPPSVTATFSPGVTSSSTTVPPSSPVAGGEKLYKVTATTDRSQTFSVNGAVPSSHWLVVGGGGAGGNSYAAGGGAGGYRTSTPETPGGPGTSAEPVFNWSPGTNYPVFVGLGGVGAPDYPAHPAGSLGNKGDPSGLNGVEADGGGGGGSINMLGGLGPGGGIGASGGGMGYSSPSPAFGAAMVTEASVNTGTPTIIVDKKYNTGIWSISGTGTRSVYGRRKQGNWITSSRGNPNEVTIVLHGAKGGDGAGQTGGFVGGLGGVTTMTAIIPTGTVLYIRKGGQGTAGGSPSTPGGTNGGGSGFGSTEPYSPTGGGGGGGYSGIFINSVSWSNALAIAGGGGGGGGRNSGGGPWPGAVGGGTTGADAAGAATGGTQGAAGSGGSGAGQLQGGNAPSHGGGGGGGYYGGGAGSYQPGGNYRGGAGGSGFVATTGTINSVPITVTASSTNQGGGTSTGLVTINGTPYSDGSTYTVP